MSALTLSSPTTEGSAVTAENLPYDVLVLIFDRLPLRDLFSCGGVSQHWRDCVTSSPRWIASQLGLNATSHADVSLGHFVSLTQIKEIKLSAAVPLIHQGGYIGSAWELPPMELLRGILTHCTHLRELDLSALALRFGNFPFQFGDDQRMFEEIWTRGEVCADDTL